MESAHGLAAHDGENVIHAHSFQRGGSFKVFRNKVHTSHAKTIRKAKRTAKLQSKDTPLWYMSNNQLRRVIYRVFINVENHVKVAPCSLGCLLECYHPGTNPGGGGGIVAGQPRSTKCQRP